MGQTWSTLTCVATWCNSDAAADDAPVIAYSNGVWTVLWESAYDSCCSGGPKGTDSDIVYVNSVNDGTTWTTPKVIDAGENSDGGSESDKRVKVAVDAASGVLVAIFVSRRRDYLGLGNQLGTDYDVYSATSNDNGQTWIQSGIVNSYAAFDTDTFGTLTRSLNPNPNSNPYSCHNPNPNLIPKQFTPLSMYAF